MSSIKYRYAADNNEQIVDVFSLKRDETRNSTFWCLGCDNILVPVLGEKRSKHFRHKADTEVSCSLETYLHKLAKTKFYEIYQLCLKQSLPFKIEYQVDEICTGYKSDYSFLCERGKATKQFDLTKYFPFIQLEKKEGKFVPDVLLISNKKEKLFVELAVTHEATQEKIQSGYRIIELNISSEDDIKVIDQRHIIENQSAKFFKFKRQFESHFCKGSKCPKGYEPYSTCLIKYNFFIIYKNGKSIIVEKTLPEFKKLQENASIAYYEIVGNYWRKNQIYIELVIKAFHEKRGIRNCYLCRYHGSSHNNYFETPIFCKFLKKSYKSNEAANCQFFKPDPEVFPIK